MGIRPLLLAAACAAASPVFADDATPDALVIPQIIAAPFTSDLPAIRKRGVLRALVSVSRTDFMLDGARPRGIMVELVDELVKELNRGLKRRELPIVAKYVVVPFAELIPSLVLGRGDVAVGNLTITPERSAKVDFVRGKEGRVDEVLVTHTQVIGIRSVDDLSGRRIHVLAGSSYAEHLRRLSARLVRKGMDPVHVLEADPVLVTEDLLELVNSGAIPMTVADDYRARLWAQVLDDITVHEDIKINAGGTMGWAVRKNNPRLRAALDKAFGKLRGGTRLGNTLIKRYYGSTRWIENAAREPARRKLDKLLALFTRYGKRYGFDPLGLAAQGYQESRLDQSATNPSGAVGIMQLLPSTARDENVGIADISSVEANIHAGVKYLAFLRDRYFVDPSLLPEDRLAFAWAAYNAGPAKVREMRRKAATLHLDPNRWFGHVEHASLLVSGREPVRYVRNIYKYWFTYRSLAAMTAARRKAVKATLKKGS